VLTGGQTGVDTLAAIAALAAGLPVQVVFPRRYLQEDGPLPPDRRRALHGAVLHELDDADFRSRTWTCVGLSDAVILLDPAGGDGCRETVRAATQLGRPLLDLTPDLAHQPESANPAASAVATAVSSFISRNRSQVLMIAGCRGSLLAGQNKTEAAEAGVAATVAALVAAGWPTARA